MEYRMSSVEITNIAKSLVEVHAVVDVSFVFDLWEIFGLFGPYGAGKTTTIRVMLDLFKADQGELSIL